MEIIDLSSGLNRRFEIAIDQHELDSECETILTKLRETAPIGGFPRGEAPIEKVKLLFGKQATATATENLVNRHLSEFVSASGLWSDAKPVIEPEFRATISKRYTGQISPDGKLRVIVGWTAEQPPVISDYRNIEVSIKMGNREDAIDNQLKILQARASTNKKVNRAVVKNDTVMVDIEVKNPDGTLVKGGKVNDYVFNPEFSDSTYFGKEINDLIIGTSVGDTFNYSHTFPENHPDSYFRGVQAKIFVELKEVNEAVIPAIDDEFAKIAEFADLAAMREHIGQLWDRNEESKQKALVTREFQSSLLASNPIPVPEKSVQSVFDHSVEELGIAPELIHHEKLAKVREELLKSATDTVRLNRIYRYVYDLHPAECRLTEADLLAYAGEEAKGKVTAEQQLLSLKGNRYYNNWVSRQQLRKVADWLLDQVIVTKVTE